MDEDRRICDVDEVPEETTLVFTYEELGLEREAILTRLADGTVVGYLNECQHWTDVPLDRGDGALLRGSDIVCQKHGATFDKETGLCDYGPCEGAVLPDVEVAVEADGVYLADEDLAFTGRGPLDDDDDDLGSAGGRIDFTGA